MNINEIQIAQTRAAEDLICDKMEALLGPRIKEPALNKYNGFDPLMTCGDSMTLRTLKKAYLKHVTNDPSIGWVELSDELGNTLAQVMGDDEFCKWLEAL